MVDGDELLPGISHFSQSFDQFRRIHFKFRCARGGIRHRYETATHERRLYSGDQSTPFSRVGAFRVLDNFIEEAG
jgi:hypothetical protein